MGFVKPSRSHPESQSLRSPTRKLSGAERRVGVAARLLSPPNTPGPRAALKFTSVRRMSAPAVLAAYRACCCFFLFYFPKLRDQMMHCSSRDPRFSHGQAPLFPSRPGDGTSAPGLRAGGAHGSARPELEARGDHAATKLSMAAATFPCRKPQPVASDPGGGKNPRKPAFPCVDHFLPSLGDETE